MVKLKGLTRISKGEHYKTPNKIIEELKNKYGQQGAKIELKDLLFKEAKI